MVDLDEAATVFPEVPAEKLSRIYEHYDDPSLARIANVLEQAKEQGKVPDSDYTGRIDTPLPASERQIHPEVADELEQMGFDPKDAERGLEAEEEADRGEWEEEAIEVADDGDLSDIMDFYLRLDQLAKDTLKSPSRSDIPEDLDIAASIISNEIQKRIEEAGLEGDREHLDYVEEQVLRVPSDELRAAYLNMLRPWIRLSENEGTEADEAREWVFEATTGEEMADRIEELQAGDRFDVTSEQLQEIAEDAKRRVGA